MLTRAERWFTVAMLIFFSNAVIWIFIGDSETSFIRRGGGTTLHLCQIAMYLTALLFFGRHWKIFQAGLAPGKWVIALSLFAVLSTLWSADPSGTAVHSIALLATTAFGIYFGVRYTPVEQIELLLRTFEIIIPLSIAFAILLPNYGRDHFLHAGAWQGVFAQKNLLGKAMLLSIIVFLSARQLLPLYLRWPAIAVSVGLLGLSRSKTAFLLAGFFFLLSCVAKLQTLQWSARFAVITVLLLLVFGVLAFALTNASLFLGLLNRDVTLSGRISLWTAVLDKISQHPILGYGYDAFWTGIRGQSANLILTLGWSAKHSHNGFLDLILDLGLAGFILYALGYLVALFQAFRLLGSNAITIWPIHYLTFVLLYYLTEGQMVRQDSLYWALYVAVSVSVCTKRNHPISDAEHEAETQTDLERTHLTNPDEHLRTGVSYG